MENRDGRERATVGVAVLAITIAFMGCYRGGKGVPVTPERDDVTCEQRLVADDGRVALPVREISPRVLLGMQVKSELTERGAALVLTTTGDVDVADIRAVAIGIIDLPTLCCANKLWHCCPRPSASIQAIELYEVPGGVKVEFVSLDGSQIRQLVVDLERLLAEMQDEIRQQEAIHQQAPIEK